MIRPTASQPQARDAAPTAHAGRAAGAQAPRDEVQIGSRERVKDPKTGLYRDHGDGHKYMGWNEGLAKLSRDMDRSAALGVGPLGASVASQIERVLSDKTPTEDLQVLADRAMAEKGMPMSFPPEVTAEVAAIRGAAEPRDASVRDLRHLPWNSIDNGELDPKTLELVNSSQDLDQLTCAERLPDDSIKIRVAIADVDSLATKGSAIDRHAMRQGMTVYTDDKIYPMLPRELSEDLTSLDPGVDRMAMVKEYTVRPDGTLADESVYQAYVHNHAKLAYNPVNDWMEGKGPTPPPLEDPKIQEQVRLQDEAAQRIKTSRFENGAIEFESRESRAQLDEKKEKVLALVLHQRNRATETIENLMVAANQVTARFLESKGMPSLRRVVKTPEKWDRIVEYAKTKGTNLPRSANSGALNAFLLDQKAKDPERFPDVCLSIVKMMGRGEYMVEVPGEDATGHFALAVSDYAHSTAPNRRGPDLVGQRIEKAAARGEQCPYTREELEDLAAHFTKQENDISKVERQVSKSAAAKLLKPQIGESFSGFITGSSPKGVWVRIGDPPVEGKVSKGGGMTKVGDQVKVKLVSVNVEKGFIDFAVEK